ncbi:hypothetical protein V865_004896 [Kwoniella europaea PYCC6329]|uniref:F-box domain-containing protein n=1 Tax=Kwoniella europaea PYCC6329 TaxID=1423913 RepID=A0AAX4KJW5_9TREE
MPSSSRRTTPSMDVIAQVFSNPYLRYLIFHDIHRKLLAPLLGVSQLFLEGGAESLYRDFDYQNYHKLVKRCENEERLSLYLGCVRTVDLSNLTRTIQVAKWSSLLSSFPNATLIKRYHDILTRQYTSGDPQSTPEYTYSYPYAEHLTKNSQEIPKGRPGIPKSWKQVKRLTLNAYTKDFGEDQNKGEKWKRALVDRVEELDSPLEGISIDFPIPNRVILEALKKVKEMGLGTPKTILLKSSDEDLFELLDLVSPTVTNLNIWINITHENTQICLREVLFKIPWKKLRCLRIFKLCVRRYPASVGDRQQIELEDNPGKSFDPEQLGNPYHSGEFHMFSEFNLQILYPPDMSEDHFKRQIQLDLEHLSSLARSMVKILGLFTSVGLTIGYKSETMDDIVKSNMYSRKMNDGLWNEMSVIRKKYWDKKKGRP